MSNQTVTHLSTPFLGQWAPNCHILACNRESLIVHPAAEPERILAAVAGARAKAILLTHAHPDHLQALGQACRTPALSWASTPPTPPRSACRPTLTQKMAMC